MFDDMFEEDDLLEDDDNSSSGTVASSNALLPPRENPDLFGHDANEKLLLDLYNKGTLPHALIFAGPMGVGKATAAFRLARFLLKHGAGADDNQDSLFGDPPPAPTSLAVPSDDPVARKVASGGHADLRYFERPIDEKKGVKKTGVNIDSVREIMPFMRRTTAEGGWRVVIVDEADTMTTQAQNAILKILEEPPPRALLILVCDRLGTILPTIRSRCRTLHFAPLEEGILSKLLLRAAPEATNAELGLLAALSDGSVGRAQLLHQEGGVNALRSFLGFAESAPKFEWDKIHPWADNLSRPDAEKAYEGFVTVAEWTARAFVRSKALGQKLPDIMAGGPLEELLHHYSLEQWIAICEKLKDHFIAIDNSNLDRRQGVIGAFAILGGQ